MNRAVKGLLVSLAVAAGVALMAYAFMRPMLLGELQVRNLVTMRAYKESIDRFQVENERLPASLVDATREWPLPPHDDGGFYLRARDSYGRPVQYVPAGDGYLLVSFGHDGRPDGSDYSELRVKGISDNSKCSDWDADQVFSDRGEHRSCGK